MKKDTTPKEELSLFVKVLSSLGKILCFIAVFPYQIVFNRKEGRFSVRSLLMGLSVSRVESEDKKKSCDIQLSIPGFVLNGRKKD